MKEKLQRTIESRLEGVEENLKYQLEALCEAVGDVHLIHYLLYLEEKEETKTPC